MNFLLLGFFFLFSINNLKSEEGLEAIYNDEPGDYVEFRKDFESKIPLIENHLKISKNLSLTPIKYSRNHEISFEDCSAISEKIERAYSQSPFKFEGRGFTSYYSLCVLDAGLPEEYQSHQGMKYFLENTQQKTTLGLISTYSLIIEKSLNLYPYNPNKSIVLLNANNQIIEIRNEIYEISDQGAFFKLRSRSVETIDNNSNYYFKSNDEPHIKRPWNIYKFTSSDGTINDAIKTERYRREDTGMGHQWIESNFYSYSSKKDWKSVFMPLSLSWFGARFEYESGFYSISKYRDFLRSIIFNGKEVCAEGDRRAFNKWTYYLEPNRKRNDCFNNW
jgi:hypothetical protein